MNHRLKVVILIAAALSSGGCFPSNFNSQNFYGRVVDQYGHPVEGVTALGTLLWITGFDSDERREQHTTLTDKNGEFEFTGYRANRLAVAVTKDDCDMGQGLGFYEAPNAANKTSPSDRAVFHIWRFRGPEPLFTARIEARLAADGTARRLDPSTGRKDTGDLIVSYTRTPLNPEPGKPFDGTLTLEIRDGGLVETADLYPYDAPTGGYNPTVSIAMKATTRTWGEAHRTYYFFDGKRYGRITLDFTAGDIRNPYLDLRTFENLSGSRNLEVKQGTHPFP